MSRFGKCQNLAGCLLAYRGEELEVAKDQPFICAECGKPLVEVKSPAAFWMRYVYAMLAVVVLAGGAFAAFPQLRSLIVKHSDRHESGESRGSADPSSTEDPSTTGDTGNPSPAENGSKASGTSGTPSPHVAEPPKFMIAPSRLDIGDAANKENKIVKEKVLTRIDLMPADYVTSSDKDKLYSAVERARHMGQVLTIPFPSGKADLSANDLQQLKTELEKPDIMNLRGDPTAVFVILGYADPKGDSKKNLSISQTRADTVLKAMRDKCGIKNIMHPVPMGGSKLLDAQNLEKNRIVEIWAVLP